jgi:arsenate reductase-like glutaredoxin family protein
VSTAVTIYHNPDCGTSCNVLGLIRNAGIEPRVIEYLTIPPSRDELAELIRRICQVSHQRPTYRRVLACTRVTSARLKHTGAAKGHIIDPA